MKSKDSPLVPTPAAEAKMFVIAHYGKWADRVLSESDDPRFLNPICGVSIQNNEIVFNRIREYWRDGCCTTSLDSPEHCSLTAEYAASQRLLQMSA